MMRSGGLSGSPDKGIKTPRRKSGGGRVLLTQLPLTSISPRSGARSAFLANIFGERSSTHTPTPNGKSLTRRSPAARSGTAEQAGQGAPSGAGGLHRLACSLYFAAVLVPVDCQLGNRFDRVLDVSPARG